MTSETVLEPPVFTTESGLIRPLIASDRQPILDILHKTAVFSPEEISIALELIDTVLSRPDQKDYVIHTHLMDGAVDGYYCIGPTPGTAGTFDLYWIAVDPSMQGKGIGQELNKHAERQIVERGGKLIIVETSSRDVYEGTRRFYTRQNYEELARIRDYYTTGDDLVIYGKYVNQNSKGG